QLVGVGERRQPALLLLFRAARPDARDGEAHRVDANRDARATPAQLLGEDELGQKVESGSAVLLGYERGRAQAELVRFLDDLIGKILTLVVMSGDGADLLLGELVGEAPDLLLLLGQREIQGHVT